MNLTLFYHIPNKKVHVPLIYLHQIDIFWLHQCYIIIMEVLSHRCCYNISEENMIFECITTLSYFSHTEVDWCKSDDQPKRDDQEISVNGHLNMKWLLFTSQTKIFIGQISSSLEVALKVSWGLLLLCKCHTIPRFNSQHLCTYVGYLYNYEQALKKFNSILNVSFMHSRRGEKQNRVLLILKCQSLRYYWEVSV